MSETRLPEPPSSIAHETQRRIAFRVLQTLLQNDPAAEAAGASPGARAARGTYGQRRIDAQTFARMTPLDALSPAVAEQQRQVRAAAARLEQRLRRAPHAQELAAELGWTLKALLQAMVQAGGGGLRADDPPLDDADALALPAWLGHLSQAQWLAAFDRGWQHLGEREREVLELLHGRTLLPHEAGLLLGLAAGRVERLHYAALDKLLSAAVQRRSQRGREGLAQEETALRPAG